MTSPSGHAWGVYVVKIDHDPTHPIPVLPVGPSAPPAGSLTLAAAVLIRSASGCVQRLTGRIDATAPSGTYFVQLHDCATVGGISTATLLPIPGKVSTLYGTDSVFDFSIDLPISVANGCVVALSTTEATYTAAGPYIVAGGS